MPYSPSRPGVAAFLLNFFYRTPCPFGIQDFSVDCAADGWQRLSCRCCWQYLMSDPPAPYPPQLGLEKIASCTAYRGPGKRLTLALKWRTPLLARPMAEAMCAGLEGIQEDAPGFDAVVPVPGFPTARRSWVPSHLLASEVAAITGVPYVEDALAKTTETRFYARSVRERSRLVQNAYVPGTITLPTGSRVLLVDDLVASGSTLRACAHQLPETRVWALTFASSLADF